MNAKEREELREAAQVCSCVISRLQQAQSAAKMGSPVVMETEIGLALDAHKRFMEKVEKFCPRKF